MSQPERPSDALMAIAHRTLLKERDACLLRVNAINNALKALHLSLNGPASSSNSPPPIPKLRTAKKYGKRKKVTLVGEPSLFPRVLLKNQIAITNTKFKNNSVYGYPSLQLVIYVTLAEINATREHSDEEDPCIREISAYICRHYANLKSTVGLTSLTERRRNIRVNLIVSRLIAKDLVKCTGKTQNGVNAYRATEVPPRSIRPFVE